MKRHLTENEIDFLVFGPEELSSQERQQWTAHIQRCSLCRQHYDLALRFRDDAYAQLSQGERRDDGALADRIAGTSLAVQVSFGSLKPPETLLGTPVERAASIRGGLRGLVRLAARSPVRTTAAGLLAAALILAGSLRLISSPSTLHSARVQNGILTAYDTEGNELWKKPARGMPEGSTDLGFVLLKDSLGDHLPVKVLNVHPSRGNELLVFSPVLMDPEDSFQPGILYCFDSQGELLWSRKYEPEGFKDFTNKNKGNWGIAKTFGLAGPPDAPNRLFVCVFYTPFSPSALLELDGTTGAVLQQYAHFGFVTAKPYRNEQGVVRLLLHGTNNSYRKPFIALMDPDAVRGFGPTPLDPSTYGYRGASGGKEIAYILFPRSELSQRFGRDLQNAISHVQVHEDGTFVVVVDEFPSESKVGKQLAGTILYSFDSHFRVTSVIFSDVIQQTHKHLLAAGESLRPLDSLSAYQLRDSVEYWNGKTLVPFHALTLRERR